MDQTHLHQWERIREKGKLRFVILYGILMWGTGSSLLFCLFKLSENPFPDLLLKSLFMFPFLGGVPIGCYLWAFMEKSREAYLKQNGALEEQTDS